MIKRFSNIIIAVILLISTNGIMIYSHYCCGSLIKQTVNIVPKDCCGTTCRHCHNESKLIKVNDNFVQTSTNKIVKPSYTYQLSVINNQLSELRNLSVLINHFSLHLPRSLPIADVVVLCSNFRLWFLHLTSQDQYNIWFNSEYYLSAYDNTMSCIS